MALMSRDVQVTLLGRYPLLLNYLCSLLDEACPGLRVNHALFSAEHCDAVLQAPADLKIVILDRDACLPDVLSFPAEFIDGAPGPTLVLSELPGQVPRPLPTSVWLRDLAITAHELKSLINQLLSAPALQAS